MNQFVLKRADKIIGLSLAVFFFVLLISTLDIGFSRDEGYYFNAGELYSKWFDTLFKEPKKAFTKAEVEKHFAYNPEHPALPKILFGLSWRLFGNFWDFKAEPETASWYDGGKPPEPILPILRESTAMRLPALMLNSMLIFLVYIFCAQFISRTSGLAAALLCGLQPHLFWHSHLACFDMPITVMWFFTVYAFFRAEQGSLKWSILTGVAFGLALNTKHNALFLLPLLALYWLATRLREFSFAKGGMKLPSIPVAFIFMLTIGPALYYLLWPKLWFDPIGHLKWYFGRHAQHEFYWAYYFGTLYTKPPFPMEFPFVMSMMTIPAPTVLLSLLGLITQCGAKLGGFLRKNTGINPGLKPLATVTAAQKHPDYLFAFLFLNFLIPFAIIAHPKVPIFGGTKHWLPGVPFLAIFAGIGFDYICKAFKTLFEGRLKNFETFRRGFIVSALLLFAAPALFETLRGHTNGSTYYNSFFGGYGAMGKYGMQREFWGNSAFSALEWLNSRAQKNAVVDFHDTNWDAYNMYLRDGLLRKDVRAEWDYQKADFHLFHVHKEFLDLEYDVQFDYGTIFPEGGVYQDGMPLLLIYKNSRGETQ
ncbi:MAG: glycosyltransferase family 39 protein [Deltaproteobacteria bacterium]|nr:glycosyltransferase family 39 protein [Deltaproteobacteria bacterium]